MGTGHYVLGVETGRGGSNGLAAPVLPGPCRAGAVATPIAGARMLRYPFVCARPLAAQDTLVLPWRREGALVQVRWADGREVTRYFGARSGEIEVPLRRLEVASQDWRAVARRFLALGVWHILAGADHLLFVLGLLMIVRGVGPLVKTITAFTLAHSLTLAATALGFAAVPVRAVESAIALSIVFLAAEILRSMRGAHGLAHRAPWVVAFAFGLLHGFGFAGALAEAGDPVRAGGPGPRARACRAARSRASLDGARTGVCPRRGGHVVAGRTQRVASRGRVNSVHQAGVGEGAEPAKPEGAVSRQARELETILGA
jgi:hypothetical protein